MSDDGKNDQVHSSGKNVPLDHDTWREWCRHVLAELERLNGSYERLQRDMVSIRVEVGMLRIKSGVWGAVGASVPILIALLIWFITNHRT